MSANHFHFEESSALPCRVAVSGNFNGGDYAYASHTEVREYADTTIGYAYSYEEFTALVDEAVIEAAARNNEFGEA